MTSPFAHEWLLAHAARAPDAPAIAAPGVRLTYRQLADRVTTFARHLLAGGVRPGDRVAVALPLAPAAVVASMGVQAAGATSVELDHQARPDTLDDVLRRCGVRQAVIWARDARAWGAAHRARPLQRLWLAYAGPTPPGTPALGAAATPALREDGAAAPGLGAPAAAALPALRPEDAALILCTSGSTGRPHAVLQTHRNVDANTRAIAAYLGLTADDRALLVLPLHYCYGRSVLQTHLLAGGSVVLEPRLAYPRVVAEALATEQCTGFAGVPLTFEILRRQVDFASLAFPRLRYLTQAGGAMAPDTIAWVRRTFHPARLFVMYGQTEATARLSYLPPERAEEKRGSIGVAIPGVELAVVDDQGRPLPPGAIGHLVARGDNVTPGYVGDPEETAAILHDGWLWTGDLAARDADGFLFLRGRAREILKVGGHRISPVEIEHVLARHPDVADAAVVGVPSELLGEAPTAFVVPRPGTAPGGAELRRFCIDRLAPYMVPVAFTLVDALPRNASGKLLRAELASRALRDRAQALQAASASAPSE